MKTGIIYDYGTFLDLEPFPCMPIGALYVDGFFMVHNAMAQMDKLGVEHILVVSELGAAYLRYAVTEFDKNGKISVTYVPEVESVGGGRLVKMGILTAVNDYSAPIPLMPGNVISDLDVLDLEGFHKARKRPYATVVCVPGKNESGLNCPTGYRPVSSMILEHKITRCCDKSTKETSMVDLLLDAEGRHQVAYYPYDGLYFEVCTPEDYLVVSKGVVPK